MIVIVQMFNMILLVLVIRIMIDDIPLVDIPEGCISGL